MKKLLVVILLVVFCASLVSAASYRNPYNSFYKFKSPTGAAVSDGGLGRIQFTLHPYLIGNKPSASVRPNTPLVGRLLLSRAEVGSPAIANDVSFLITVIYPNGETELYGYGVEGILPSNVFAFDPNEQAWVNDKFVARGEIKTKISYVVSVYYKGKTKVVTPIQQLNVR